MKKIFSKYIIAAGLFAILASGCEKQLEIEPQQSIDAETALESRDALEAVITGLYARLKSARMYGRDYITHPEALADNGFATNKSGRLIPEANNTQPNSTTGANHFTVTPWASYYAGINQINLALEELPTLEFTPAITPAERDRWEGQMYFLRGLMFFDMVKVYAYIPGAVVAAQDRGGIPVVLTGISTAESALAFLPTRDPIDVVYAQIINDLTKAEAKLLSTASVNLANKGAAQGLLARVSLYKKDYTAARSWADKCIATAGSKMTTVSNYVTNWRLGTHNESIFQVAFLTNGENIGVNESLQTSFTTLVTPGNQAVTGGFGDLVPTLSLLTDLGITLTGGMTTTNFALSHTVASRSTDVRNLLYEPGTAGRGNIKVECTKYLGKNGFINLDNVPVFRISEAYLIRAEAQATAGSPVFNLGEALADMQFLKTRRYTDYAGSAQQTADAAMTGPQLYEEILRQRRIEFAYEGHRFFDLKRLGRDIIKQAPPYSNLAFTDTRVLAPIPQADVDGNPNLRQNAGY
ncbi:MAG TPA: RagB/SusD family nutrient uptake outer membrane protein [Chitinophagaceae bacterium]